MVAFKTLRAGLVAGAAALTLGQAALAEGPTPTNQQGDITALCGDKPMRVGFVDGFAGSTWRKIVAEEARDELSNCDNVEDIRFADAGGDQQKYIGDLNSFVAQGMDIIIAMTDFGDAATPAYRKAYRDGVTMVPYFAPLSGTIGQDYAANPYQDQAYVGELWADWFNEALPDGGNVVFIGGVPGAPSSQQFMLGFTRGVNKYDGLNLLQDDYVVSNWNAADTQKAVAGLIAKHPQIDGIATDYGVVTLAAVKSFVQAGLPVPAQATLASDNEVNCRYLSDAADEAKAWDYYSLDGTTRTIRFAVRAAVAEFQGIENNENRAIIPFDYVNSLTGLDPKCDPNAPLDADLSTGLPEDKLYAIFE